MFLRPDLIEVIDRIFSLGNAASLADFPDPGKVEPLLEEMVQGGIAARSLLVSNRCPQCLQEMEPKLGLVLYCQKCGHSIDLQHGALNRYSSFSVDETGVAKLLRLHLERNGTHIREPKPIPDMPGIVQVGSVFLDSSGWTLEVVLSSKPVAMSTIYSLLGVSEKESCFFMLAYSTLEQGLKESELAAIALPSMKMIRLPTLLEDDFGKELEGTLGFSTLLMAHVTSIAGTFNEGLSIPLSGSEASFIRDVIVLSEVGREKFEPIAARLLGVLGPTACFSRPGAHPDGVLFLSNGFYIVDAKSSQTYFKFSVPERDKLRRYVRIMAQEVHKFGSYKFYGEIILTRDHPDLQRVILPRVERDLRKDPIEGNVVVLSVEALLSLYRRAWANTEYFFRLDMKSHPLQLFRAAGRFLPTDTAERSKPQFETLTYVNQRRIDIFLDQVMRSDILLLDFRNKESAVSRIFRVYEASLQ